MTDEEFIITEERRKELESEIKERDEKERNIFNAGMKFGKKLAFESIRKFVIEQRKELEQDAE